MQWLTVRTWSNSYKQDLTSESKGCKLFNVLECGYLGCAVTYSHTSTVLFAYTTAVILDLNETMSVSFGPLFLMTRTAMDLPVSTLGLCSPTWCRYCLHSRRESFWFQSSSVHASWRQDRTNATTNVLDQFFDNGLNVDNGLTRVKTANCNWVESLNRVVGQRRVHVDKDLEQA